MSAPRVPKAVVTIGRELNLVIPEGERVSWALMRHGVAITLSPSARARLFDLMVPEQVGGEADPDGERAFTTAADVRTAIGMYLRAYVAAYKPGITAAQMREAVLGPELWAQVEETQARMAAVRIAPGLGEGDE